MNKKILYLTALIAAFLLNSCDELFQEQEAGKNDMYLKSYTELKTISQIEANAIFAYLAALYPDASAIGAEVTSGLKVFKITYNTEFMGDTIEASGLVCAPIGDEEYPIISFQNGTNTENDKAPTKNPDGELFQFLEAVSSTGFVMAIPDYIGFGASSDYFHPYLDSTSTVQSTLDMLRATRELLTNHKLLARFNGDLYITGYSMGGWATLQLQKAIEINFSDEFNLKASACGAGPYDLLFITNDIVNRTTYPMPYFLGFMLQSYINLGYITNDYDDIINEPYASRIPSLYDGTLDGETINAQLTTSMADLFTSDFKNNYKTSDKFSSVRVTLLNNSIGAWNISTPLTLLHGEADDFITPQVTENIYNEFLSIGVTQDKIKLVTFPGAGHSEGIVPAGIASISWFLQIRDNP